jgi:hypothetical protein
MNSTLPWGSNTARTFSGEKWTPVLLAASLVCFFLATLLLGFQGPGIVAKENTGRALVFLFLVIVSLMFSWASFINAMRSFRYHDDKRWAWFYIIFTDIVATLITVAGLYSVYSILTVVAGL